MLELALNSLPRREEFTDVLRAATISGANARREVLVGEGGVIRRSLNSRLRIGLQSGSVTHSRGVVYARREIYAR